ncbi:DUF4097 family beta strand repeat-containing protein [Embleya scabrispora]|uniref:DUF4097 family beta strand repeat-containing protein n=1 Tax=Embleya scabrispora TaxID=159449 RepID=UPI00036514D0|nr:DUF4097 family beta strand repeat-containing protein [Embleya scabrispora]MYS87569.1 DUF4097 family beta strand repeat protein [Streptomyces sp. SID5474]
MPRFDTPKPISATLEFDIGSVRISASDRTDTVVEVVPGNSADEIDVRAAQQTTVTCSGGRLLINGPKKRSLFGKNGSVEISVELPAGSDVRAATPMADFTCSGPLGDCRLKTSVGTIRMDEARALYARTDHGDIRVARTTGDAEIIAAGRIEIGTVTGAATIRNTNGETTVGEVGGDLRANSSNGRITVGVAHADVDAKCAHGAIRIDEVARGQVHLHTGVGDLEVGIRKATAAWLDVQTRMGSVRNSLGATESPEESEESVEVRARTSFGHILIRRA